MHFLAEKKSVKWRDHKRKKKWSSYETFFRQWFSSSIFMPMQQQHIRIESYIGKKKPVNFWCLITLHSQIRHFYIAAASLFNMMEGVPHVYSFFQTIIIRKIFFHEKATNTEKKIIQIRFRAAAQGGDTHHWCCTAKYEIPHHIFFHQKGIFQFWVCVCALLYTWQHVEIVCFLELHSTYAALF